MVNRTNNKSFSYDLMRADFTSMDRERVAEWKRCGHVSIVFEVSEVNDRVLFTPTAGRSTFSANLTTTNKYGRKQVIGLSEGFAREAFQDLNETTDLCGTTLPSLMCDIADELRTCAEVMKEMADVVLNPHPDVHS